MMKVLVIAAVLVCLATGCSSTRMVGGGGDNREKDQLTYQEVQDRLRGKTVRVILVSGEEIHGSVGRIARDSVRLWNDEGADSVVVPTREVRGIEKVDRAGGGLLGFLGGTCGGFLVGAGVGAVSTPHGGDMRGLGVALSALGWGCLGAVGGTIYGVSHGIVNYYEFLGDSVVTGIP